MHTEHQFRGERVYNTLKTAVASSRRMGSTALGSASDVRQGLAGSIQRTENVSLARKCDAPITLWNEYETNPSGLLFVDKLYVEVLQSWKQRGKSNEGIRCVTLPIKQ